MKKSRLFVIPLTALLLSGCVTSGAGSGTRRPKPASTTATSTDTAIKTTSDPTSDTSGTTPISGEIENGAHDGYYNLEEYNLNGLSGPNLIREIHRMMLDTHRSLVLYSQFQSYTKQNDGQKYSIDQVSSTVQKNEFFYTGKQNAFSTSYTREHVWPCAKSGGLWVHSNYSDIKYYVDGAKYAGGGSDLYHVRPCTSAVNTARGDSRFVEFSEEEKATKLQKTDGGPYAILCDAEQYSGYSEPADEFKGDVARICVYVYIHYARIGTYNWNDYCGSLALTDLFGYPGTDEKEVQKMLVRWNELDPVSETEKLRNDTVQPIQGNRNPFVDYPHLMRKMFNIK